MTATVDDAARPSFPAHFGLDISRWPRTKLAHARRRIDEIRSVMGIWRSTAPITIHMEPNDDLTALHGIARVNSQPPLDEIALLLGDVLHSLRSGLDNLAWELAHIGGRSPRNEKQLYFPICRTEEAWHRKLPTLNTWPEESVRLAYDIQPFHHQEIRQSPLLWLEELNLREKHRQRLEVIPGGMAGNARFNIALSAGATMRFTSRNKLPKAFDGLEIMRVIIEPAALKFIPEPIECEPELTVRLDSAVSTLDVLLSALSHDVERTMLLLTGELDPKSPRPILAEPPTEPEDDADEEGFSPVKVVTVTHKGPL